MTSSERDRINRLMEQFEGDRGMVANALGVPRSQVNTWITGDSELRARWVNAQDRKAAKKAKAREVLPGMVTMDGALEDYFTVNAQPVPDPARTEPAPAVQNVSDAQPKTPFGQKLAENEAMRSEALAVQDGRIAELGWEGLIQNNEEADLMREFEKFVGGKIVRTIDASHGGTLYVLARVSWQFKRVSDELAKLPVTSEAAMMLQQRQNETAHLIVKLNAEATRAAHTRALIEKTVREASAKANGKTRRPGFKRATPVRP